MNPAHHNPDGCYACGDTYGTAYLTVASGDTRLVCRECYAELRFGIIKNQNINFFGGRGTQEDDGGPWQQNAARALEENRE